MKSKLKICTGVGIYALVNAGAIALPLSAAAKADLAAQQAAQQERTATPNCIS